MSRPRVVSLEAIQSGARAEYGGKAVQLAGLSRLGYPVPPALVIGAGVYRRFARGRRIRAALRAAESHAGYPAPAQEPFWDLVRLRILQEPLPDDLRRELLSALTRLFPGGRPPLAVRSSAPGEDAASASFAGIYRS